MNYKKVPIIIGVVAVAAIGAFLARQAQISFSEMATPAKGVLNEDPVVKGLVAAPAPQLTDRGFEPLPSMGTGSYTEPASKADTKMSGDAKN